MWSWPTAFCRATRMSTRLEGSTGHDGTLKVALGDPGGLFQLELMMNADLAQAQQVLARIVKDPAFSAGLAKITDLKGSGTGKLVLGDRLDRIKARWKSRISTSRPTYQGVPLPIEIHQRPARLYGKPHGHQNPAGPHRPVATLRRRRQYPLGEGP